MMNPSTADPMFDDSTVFTCRKYAESWGYDGYHVGNIFAYRTTDQKMLLKLPNPIGPDNDAHLLDMATAASLVVFAFGQPGSKALRARGSAVAKHLRDSAGIKCHMLALSRTEHQNIRSIRSTLFKPQSQTSNPVVRNARITHLIPLRRMGLISRLRHRPAVSPIDIRKYADRDIQAAFDAWKMEQGRWCACSWNRRLKRMP
ncbi:DUF1643 domain-containing protein [Tunturibacter psychrotolerans]|uniref:DUF1643 domain-containing protein n=1 Tax=Tunturiibacter psychrotolerans TaxID=3069686 RepID=A0AAU7ZRS0_9BACT